MRASLLFGISLCVAFSGIPALCQGGTVRTQIEGIEIPPIPNAPFTAKVAVTWDEPLTGGGTVSKKYYTMVARDSQGRVHRETRGFIPADSNDEPPLRSVTILDPISSTRTVCTEASLSCAAGAFHSRIPLGDETKGLPVSSGNVSRQNLGQHTIYGLPVTGTREVATGVAGSHGSSRVALSNTEVWYSADLHMALSVIRNNPQLGQVTLTVTDLVRAEPDSSLFAPPSGYELRNIQGK